MPHHMRPFSLMQRSWMNRTKQAKQAFCRYPKPLRPTKVQHHFAPPRLTRPLNLPSSIRNNQSSCLQTKQQLIAQTSATLIDHIYIYTNNPDVITEVSVPDLSISDHCPISCSRSIKLPKCEPKTHSYISFRSFEDFNKAAFFNDLHWSPQSY